MSSLVLPLESVTLSSGGQGMLTGEQARGHQVSSSSLLGQQGDSHVAP